MSLAIIFLDIMFLAITVLAIIMFLAVMFLANLFFKLWIWRKIWFWKGGGAKYESHNTPDLVSNMFQGIISATRIDIEQTLSSTDTYGGSLL